MVESQWRRRFGPAILAFGVLALAGFSSADADDGTWSPPDCTVEPAALVAASQRSAGQAVEAKTPAWFRLDLQLDDRSALSGQRLVVGGAGGQPPRSVALAAESFAAGPFGGLILAGSDDGATSVLRLIDVPDGCSSAIATEADVVRRATIDPGRTAIYEFRVDRTTRADLGVWRRPLDGSSRVQRVVPPIEPNDVYGPTFSTELAWTLERARLVIQSCGASACRTRVFDPATGKVRSVDTPGLGELVGVTGDRLISYRACPGRPCPIDAVDLATGTRTELSAESGVAVLVDSDAGPRLVHESSSDAGVSVHVVDPFGRGSARTTELERGRGILPDAGRGGAAVDLPEGWVALIERDPDGFARPSVVLRNIDAGPSITIEEVIR